jgi:hypothetical protein
VTGFHCARALYQPGDIIQPGNWGKVIEGIGISHDQAWREIAFEMARREVAPGAASRLRSVFCLTTEQDARAFAIRDMSGLAHIYEIEQVDDGVARHRGDLQAFAAFPNTWGIDSWRGIMSRYWMGEAVGQDPSWEILLESAVRVIRHLGRA